MAMLPRDEREEAFGRIAESFERIFAGRLRGLFIYGSALTSDYLPGRSDINVFGVLDSFAVEDWPTLRVAWEDWSRTRAAVPFLLEESFLARAGEVFPLEMLELKERHFRLAGRPVLDRVRVNLDQARRQLAFALRSHYQHFCTTYVQMEFDEPKLRAALTNSSKSFLFLFRRALRLAGVTAPLDTFEETRKRFARHFVLDLHAFAEVLRLRREPDAPLRRYGSLPLLLHGYAQDIHAAVSSISGI